MAPASVYVSAAIRHAAIDGRIVILNLATEDYAILNEPASAIWSAIHANGGDLEKTSGALTTLFRLDPQQSRQKLDQFVANCLDQQLLCLSQSGAGHPHDEPRKRRPILGLFLTVRAWWNLFCTWYALSTKGFSRTYLSYGRTASAFGGSPHIGKRLAAAQAAFLRAENFFWYRSAPLDCVPRSLALFRFLRSAGVPATHHIGGRFKPFLTMHAWVQLGGSVILDDSRYGHEYTLLASLPL